MLGRRHFVALAVEDADVELGQVFRILVHVLDQVLLDDALGHRPVGVELHLVDLGVEDRRGAIDLADHGGVALHDLRALDRLDRGGRNVDDHIAIGQRRRPLLDAHGVEAELVQPVLGRHRQRVEGRLIDLAVDDEAVAGLEQAHGGIELVVELVVDALLERHVAVDHQPALELR